MRQGVLLLSGTQVFTDNVENHKDCRAMCVSFCETNVHASEKIKIEHKSVFLGR